MKQSVVNPFHSCKSLSHRALEGQLEQFLSLHCELHRKAAQDLLGISVDYQTDGVFRTYAALVAVEQLVFAYLRGGGLVFDRGRRVGIAYVRESVGAAGRTYQQAVALGVVPGSFSRRNYLYQTAVAVLAPAGGDALADYTAAGVAPYVYHLRARVRLLHVVGHGH